MTQRFLKFIEWVISWEGSVFEDDKSDPGGKTKYGIDQRSHPKVDIRNLTKEQAEEIYWNESWVKLHAEELPLGVSEILSNIAINTGYGHATKWLQFALNTQVDGIIGPNTIKLANAANRQDLNNKLLDHLEQYYHDIAAYGDNQKFIKGWLHRTDSLREFVNQLKP